MEASTNQLWLMLLASGALALIGLLTSRRRDPLWILDPRGLFGLVLMENAVGVVAHRLLLGEYPDHFGLISRHLFAATWMLVSVQAGVLAATFLPVRWLVRFAPRLSIREARIAPLLRTMFWGSCLSASFVYWRIELEGVESFLARYGALQWSENLEQLPAYLNLGLLSVPTLVATILLWGAAGRRLTSPKLWGAIIFVALPALAGGGRRDLILIVLALVAAGSVGGRRPIRSRHVLSTVVAVVLLSYGVAISREGESLGFADRLSAAAGSLSLEGQAVAAHVLTMYAGTGVLTAAMEVFPDREAFAGGVTYLQALGNVLVPHVLTGYYAFVPAGVRFRELFYSDVVGFGMDYSLAAEAYQNFGVAGPFLASLALGLLVSAIYTIARARQGTLSFWLVIHLHVFWSALWSIRTDSNTTMKLFVFLIAWFFVLWFISRAVGRFSSVRPDRPGALSSAGREN